MTPPPSVVNSLGDSQLGNRLRSCSLNQGRKHSEPIIGELKFCKIRFLLAYQPAPCRYLHLWTH